MGCRHHLRFSHPSCAEDDTVHQNLWGDVPPTCRGYPLGAGIELWESLLPPHGSGDEGKVLGAFATVPFQRGQVVTTFDGALVSFKNYVEASEHHKTGGAHAA